MDTNRRQLLKVLGAGGAGILAGQASAGPQTPPPHHPTASSQAAMPPAPEANYQPKNFNDLEWRTVKVLADLILPADDRSGSATEAGVPQFIDQLVSARPGTMEIELRGGLAWLNQETNRRFERDFPACTEAQRKEILDAIAYPKKAPPELSQAVAFFNLFRDLTAGGFYTSKMGIADLRYMGNTAVETWEGCPEEVVKAVMGTGQRTDIRKLRTTHA